MAEYCLDFAKELLDAAKCIESRGLKIQPQIRAALYLSKLSSEITLKALLEKAGKPASEIKKIGHDLSHLLLELHDCQIKKKIVANRLNYVSAACIRGVNVDENFNNATLGNLLSAEEAGASKYPNELRYGENFTDYPPQIIIKMADVLLSLAHKHWNDIKLR